MSLVAFDTNILIHAEFESRTPKGTAAKEVLRRGRQNGVVPLQVIGELLRFTQRRFPTRFDQTLARAALYRKIYAAPVTTAAALEHAALLCRRHNIQFWDAVICAVSLETKARVLFTEDMQSGSAIGGLRLINPFEPANAGAFDAAFQ